MSDDLKVTPNVGTVKGLPADVVQKGLSGRVLATALANQLPGTPANPAPATTQNNNGSNDK